MAMMIRESISKAIRKAIMMIREPFSKAIRKAIMEAIRPAIKRATWRAIRKKPSQAGHQAGDLK
jgi:siroheme synthase (precorrin-2 oxidase/ferrochelatase)